MRGQRVALAKIILKNPPLILADEPTAALDPETSKDIMTRLIALKNDHRVIVIATHNPIIWEMKLFLFMICKCEIILLILPLASFVEI